MAKKPVAENSGQHPVTNDASITLTDWQAATGTLSGMWSDPAHWSAASVPGANSVANIGTGLSATDAWTVTAGSEAINSLILDAGDFGTLSVTGSMDLSNVLEVNTGLLQVNAGAMVTASSVLASGGNFVIDGGALNGGSTAELDGTTMLIANGGTVTAGNLWQSAFGTGIISVQGVGSLLDVTTTLEIGSDGPAASPFNEGLGTLLMMGGGQATVGSLYVTNTSTVSVDAQSALVVGSGASVAGAMVIGSGATATVELSSIDANVVDNGTLDVMLKATNDAPGNGPTISGALSGDGKVLVSTGYTLEVASVAGFTGSISVAQGGELKLDAGGDAGGTISFAGGTVDLASETYVAGMMPGYNSSSGLLTVMSATLDVGTGLSVADFTVKNDGNGGTLITEAPCYVAGTRILAEHGEAAVETLREGDRVRTADGRLAPVRWVGRMRVDLARHPAPHHAAPIRIAANAFAPGLPKRDLLVSPDHALLAEGVLIPARRLVNGATIRAEPNFGVVTYVHVELDRHDLLLAEGLAAESYLDTGNRGSFAGNAGVRGLHPDFVADPEAAALQAFAERGCRPLVIHGEQVIAAHAALLARAEAHGYALTRDPALCIESDVDGMSVEPDGRHGLRLFLPLGAQTIRVRSRSFVPEALDAGCGDGRRLGVALAARLNGRAIPASAYGAGWHAPEGRAAWRWTDGDATLRLHPRKRPAVLTLHLLQAGARYWAAPLQAAVRAA